MKLKPFKRIPVWVACGVITLVCLARWAQLEFFDRLERMTYDMRVRAALHFSPTVATNLGFVFIDEESVKRVWDGSLGYRFGLYWPRQVYGRLVNELARQGAKAVALDILFGELRPDHPPVLLADGNSMESDDFFAEQLFQASNVIIAVTKEITPPPLFLTNALAVGDITTEKDSDGILRRVQIFRTATNWHRAFRQAAEEFGLDLDQARVEKGQIILPRPGGEAVTIPLDADGNFDLADFVGDKIPPGMKRKDKLFTTEPVWHMGVVLAAQELHLDLAKAEVDLPHGRITLRGAGGVERVIPVDANGYAYIDWCLPPNDSRLTQEPIEDLLLQNLHRLQGQTQGLTNRWRGKLVVVGSSAIIGNNLTDRGATPLFRDTILVSKHWNVASSIITDRFVRRASLGVELGLIVLLGVVAAIVTWRMRVLLASGLLLLLGLAYVAIALVVYVRTRYWLPVVLPLGGAMLMTHLLLVTWRVVFEQAKERRVRSVFSTIVSPKIVQELLQAEKLSLEGARREISVLFADVRGFTQWTDSAQERAADYARQHRLAGLEAEAYFDQQARETLATINLYLGLVADTIKKHDGTWDKFIGDCVMAFWGAPTSNPRHAAACVRAALEAQCAIYDLNHQRAAENEKREEENQQRRAAGLPPLQPLPILFLGTGINTGLATVGLMGSGTQAGVESANYTVFGREVNLASRLEGASGRGRIFISETTYEHLRRDDPALAASCMALEPVSVKGFRTAIKVYEVPWRAPGALPLEEEFATKSASDTTAFVEPV